MPSVQTILILASNPSNSNRLRLDEEVREIEDVLRKADKRDLFEVKHRPATRIDDIQQALLDYEPQIVHFCGHGEGEEGLVFEDNAGCSQLVSSQALVNLFELFKNEVKCVVLNACYSEIQAKAITTHIDTVIGMRQAIGDTAAIVFSKGFYGGLGAGRSVEFSYKLGCNRLELKAIPEAHVPVLRRHRRFTDPNLPNAPKQELSSQLKQSSELIEIPDKVSTVVKASTVSLTSSLTKSEKAKESQKKGMRSWEYVQTLSQELGSSVVLATPDSKSIIIGAQRKIKVFNFVTKELAYTLEGVEGKINALAISPDSKYLMSGGYDKTISIWDLNSKRLKKKIPSNRIDTKGLGNITSIACSGDFRYIYTGDTRGVARAWNVDSAERSIFDIPCHSTAIGSISLNSTYSWLATCGDDKKVRLIDLNTNKIVKKELKDSDRIQAIDFSSDDNFLIYAGDSGNVHFYDVRTWENRIFHNQKMAVKSVVISPNNNYFFCAGLNKAGQGSIKIWKLSPTSKRAIRTLEGHKGAVGSLAITPNGKTLISSSTDQTVKIWEGNVDACYGNTKTVTVNQPMEISEFPKVLDENLESYITYLEKVLFQKKRFTLKADHNALIRGAYYRKSYAQIAAESGFAETYLKSVSGKLWKLLSDILKVKVDKQGVRKLVQTFAKK